MSSALLLLFPFLAGDAIPAVDPVVVEDLVEAGPLGRSLIIEVYEALGTTPIGIIPDVISSDTEELINGIGNFSISLPITAHNVALLTHGREVAIIPYGEVEHIRGIIEDADTQVRDDETVLVVSGSTIIQELTYYNTYHAVVLDNQTYTLSIDAIISGSGWLKTLTGAGYVNITRRYDNFNLYEALIDLAAIEGAYVRETTTLRTLELKNTNTASGIRLMNMDSAGPEAFDNVNLGLIAGMKKVVEGHDIWNRIVPESNSNDQILVLGDSSRTTPYTIQSFTKASPSTTNQLTQDFTTAAEDSHEVGGITLNGRNRALLVFIVSNINLVANTVLPSVTANSKKVSFLTSEFWGTTGADTVRLTVYGLVNPDEGTNSITLEWNTGFLPSAGSEWLVVCQGFQDVDPRVPIGDYSVNQISSDLAFAADIDTFEGDLIIGALFPQASIIARGTGQESIYSDGITPFYIDTKVAVGGPDGVNWTLNSVANYIFIQAAIKSARVWYIEDATSIAAYRRRTKILQLGDFKVTYALGIEFAANTMYDRAASYLLKQKDPVPFYETDVGYLPGTSKDWLVGDTFPVSYVDASQNLNVDETLICVKRNAHYDSDGIRTWKLDLSTTARRRQNVEDELFKAIARINTIQNSQV